MPTTKDAPITPFAYRCTGSALAAVCCFRLGIAYTPVSNPPAVLPDGLKIIVAFFPNSTDNWEPIWLFGFGWLLLGVLILASIGLPRLHTPTYLAIIFGTCWWAGAYVAAATERAWVTASTYVLLVGFLALVGLMTRPIRRGDDE